MDPYLEDPVRWGGVHQLMISAIVAALNRALPAGFVAEVELFVWSGDQPEDEAVLRRRKPDVFIPRVGRTKSVGATSLAVAPPTVVTRLPERHVRRNKRVEVQTADGREVVTVLELLSPANKRTGEDRTAYLTKRGEFFASQANFVEIDLLRDGDRMPMGNPHPPPADYYVFVSPADRRAESQVWAWNVSAAIPVFPVPLRRKVPPVPLDLRACLERVYEEGRYEDKLNYRTDPVPPLRAGDADWAADLLKRPAKKKR
jgi:hypothetical protein